jgi:hypothetical protein
MTKPIDLLLFCPNCGAQHIDQAKPDECENCGLSKAFHDEGLPYDIEDVGSVCDNFAAWLNPPHKSHRCSSCNHVWRPGDVPTNGVQFINTKGLHDKSAFPEYDITTIKNELERLNELINTPHTADFLEAVPLEAAHQIARWGTEHDEGKQPTDWLWLIGYLAGKATNAAIKGDLEKAKHHTISTAAVCLNWFRRIVGDEKTFRPGIEPVEVQEAQNNG